MEKTKKLLALVMGLVTAGVLVAGCGSKPAAKRPQASKGSFVVAPPPPVPFSQIKAGALDTVDFVSDTVGYAGGGQGLILKSTDGGKTWMKLYATTS